MTNKKSTLGEAKRERRQISNEHQHIQHSFDDGGVWTLNTEHFVTLFGGYQKLLQLIWMCCKLYQMKNLTKPNRILLKYYVFQQWWWMVTTCRGCNAMRTTMIFLLFNTHFCYPCDDVARLQTTIHRMAWFKRLNLFLSSRCKKKLAEQMIHVCLRLSSMTNSNNKRYVSLTSSTVRARKRRPRKNIFHLYSFQRQGQISVRLWANEFCFGQSGSTPN